MYVAPSLEAPQQLETQVDNADVMALTKSRVTIVGSGNWGSVAAKLIASNALKLPSFHGSLSRCPPLLSELLVYVIQSSYRLQMLHLFLPSSLLWIGIWNSLDFRSSKDVGVRGDIAHR